MKPLGLRNYPTTLVDMLLQRGEQDNDRTSFIFVDDDVEEVNRLSFADLDRKARAIGTRLQEIGMSGERALMLYTPGLEFITGYFGCLYAGAIAVPSYPPDPTRLDRTLPRLRAIVNDCKPKVIITSGFLMQMAQMMFPQAPELADITWIATDEIDDAYSMFWQDPNVRPETLAFLQYTSGSTGTPKGVMVTHHNLVTNEQLIRDIAQFDSDVSFVSWLPSFHDMGLIGGILQPIFSGALGVQMSPLSFLQKPYRWLHAITKYRATHSGAPNFAYDLAVARISEEQRATLDLSTWVLAFCGAEPVRGSTIDRFCQTYEPYGFKRAHFLPAYGLAEATLGVSAGRYRTEPNILTVAAAELEKGAVRLPVGVEETRVIVTSGWGVNDTTRIIVDPVSLETLPDNRVGEVWVGGSGVAVGYWERPEESEKTYRARTAEGTGPWLRTGDLGFIRDGELYVTGRHKDLIIIRGRNHYPQDIELTTDNAHPYCRQGCCAAFSLDIDGNEELMIVVEVDPRKAEGKLEEVAAAIRKAVSAGHDLTVWGIIFIQPRTIDKTSSGKIQRRASKKGYLENDLAEVGRSIQGKPSPAQVAASGATPTRAGRTFDKRKHSGMVKLLAEKLGARVGLSPDKVDIDAPFVSFGLSSQDAVGLSGELEDALSRKLSPTLLYNFPNISALALHLSGEDVAVVLPSARPTHSWDEPIAVVGMGMRLPGGVRDPDSLWRLLMDGVDAISEVPADRWDVDAYYDANPAAVGKMYTRWGGFLPEVDQFDARFFGISPREADGMDPQQRLLLTVAWEALENAGQNIDKLEGSATGVFMGLCANDYASGTVFSGDPRRIDAYCGTGNAGSVAAGRISYLFGFKGPAVTLDTACSSSLVALHLAAQSLRSGETDLALAGGVSLILGPEGTIFFSRLGAMAADGRCKTFDESANGYVRSEGCGVVVLKRLSDAQRDGDPIWAVVRGSAINQDGRSNGLTAPNGPSQEEVIRSALAQAGVEPTSLSYLEAHGTGTPLGDPIELTAIGHVVRGGRDEGQPLRVGSIKTNIGHTEAAAGIAGLMKVVLSLHHQMIPANLHFKKPSSQIPWDTLPITIPTEATPWPAEGEARFAGVSSFGFSGTNAHVVLEGAPRRANAEREESHNKALILPLSARDPRALQALATSLGNLLTADNPPVLSDVLHTLSVRRASHVHRAAIVGTSPEGFAAALKALGRGEPTPGTVSGRVGTGSRRKVVFVFPGQGSQWLGMGRQLMASEPSFRAALEACAVAISKHADWSLMEVLQSEVEPTRIDVIQPTLWAVMVALAALWRQMGVEPDMVVGHSMGETAAAYVAGAISLDHAAQIICRRSRLMRKLSGQGLMAVVELTAEEATKALVGFEDKVSVAVSNSPRSTVISGDPAAVETILGQLEAKNVFCRKVKVDVASHSPQMDPIRDELLAELSGVTPREGTIPICSTVTTEVSLGGGFDPIYWTRNLREVVQFGKVVGQLIDSGHSLFVEVSPHPILLPAVEQLLKDKGSDGLAVGSLRRNLPERDVMLESLGALWTRGMGVEWRQIQVSGSPVPLPSYPWQTEHFWYSPLPRRGSVVGGHPLLGPALGSSVSSGTWYFERPVDTTSLEWLGDHKVQDAVVLPAAAYIEMALSAGRQVMGEGNLHLRQVHFLEVMAFTPGAGHIVQTVLTPEAGGGYDVRISSRPEAGGAWVLHNTTRLSLSTGVAPSLDLATVKARCVTEIPATTHYQRLSDAGLNYGPAFRGVKAITSGTGEALATLALPNILAGGAGDYLLHPALLDAAFQTLSDALATVPGSGPAVPVRVEELEWFRAPVGEVGCHVTLGEQQGKTVSGHLELFDASGCWAHIKGLMAQQLESSTPSAADEVFLQIDWDAVPAAPAPALAAGTWLVLADHTTAPALVSGLKTSGHTVITVKPGSATSRSGEGWVVDPSSPAGFKTLLGEIFAGGTRPCLGILHLWNLDHTDDVITTERLREIEHTDVLGLLHLVQGAAELRWRDPPRVWVVTRGSVEVHPGDGAVMAGATLWGAAGSIGQEHSEWRLSRFDLPMGGEEGENAALLAEILADDREDQITFRHGERHVARLVRKTPETDAPDVVMPAGDRPFRLEIDKPGVLDHLTLRGMSRRAPGPGEVEIHITAAGLNFLDVMKAMGIYPGLGDGPVPLGGECAGRVVALGSGVDHVQVGQEVIAIAPFAFASHATTSAHLVVPAPRGFSPQTAAALPSVYATTWYALYQLAHLSKGDKILIHSATGGTGLAAVALARRVGAEVFATAGSETKRNWLKTQGITHVYDSRTLDFSAQILADTGGRGVDVVLNSLAGEAIEKSFACLATDGHFLELGKRDIYSDRPLGMAVFKKRISYSAIDLAGLAAERPERFHQLLLEVVGAFERGELTPPPVAVYPITEVREVFRTMAQARHTGKIVFDMNPAGVSIAAPRGTGQLDGEGTYLISGGLGGLGLSVAAWMVSSGARHLALTGRSGITTESQKQAIDALVEQGAHVEVVKVDVSDAAALDHALTRLRSSQPPLKGVIHAAGVLDDGMAIQQTPARYRKVLAPKVDGAWNLHQLTQNDPLDFFVMYSSGASLLSSPGQSNYAAGNNFLDTLAHHRRAKGQVATSINWGAFSEVGLAAAEANRADRLAGRGMRSLTPAEGVQLLARIMTSGVVQVGVIPLNVRQWVEFYPQAAGSPLLTTLLADVGKTKAQAGDSSLKVAVMAASPEERPTLLEKFLREQVGAVLRLDPERIDRDTPLKSLGIDSLMGMELRNRMESGTGLTLSATLIWTYPTLGALSRHLAERIVPPVEVASATPVPAEVVVNTPAVEVIKEEELSTLSDEELAALGDDLLD